ncbi:restriction endonuclease subunit S [Arenibacter sp. M-2]|uniref:restriction endonuclease subunit S n=1 Tax=Arenibacter sp. M-2 TaxID=3053612 RepID=UPI00257119CA|nr:restriction endonuclease subunit S [Arenibacter sp. M-2]MDL5515068.1 restriction endonuclease subunit S [Arenibacter sp. M-2]
MELLEKYFEIAINTPDGITRLRELILKLAIRGSLTIQDKNELSGDKLLGEIQLEKKSLFKQGRIKKQIYFDNKNNPIRPFIIPDNWIWTSLNNIVSLLGDGIHGTPQYDNHGEYYFINGNNLTDGRIEIKSNTKTITEKEFQKHKRDLTVNTVLVSINGTLGNVAFYDNEKVILGKSACYFNLMHGINKHYIKYIIKSNYFKDYAFTNATGSTIKNVSLKSMRELPIPLPPKEEQNRVVLKIEELMNLCDQLEKQRDSKSDILSKINNSAIDKLIKAEGEIALIEAATFINDKFGELYSTNSNLEGLKKAILNIGISGRFKIDAKTSKHENQYPSIPNSEEPFKLPVNWIWTKLDNLGETQTGTTPPKKNPEYYGNYIPFLGPGDIKDFKIDYTNNGLSELGLEKARFIAANSILMVCIGGSIGKMAINDRDVTCNQQVNTITPYDGVHLKYLSAVLQSDYFQTKILANAGGSATPIINKGKWISIPIPLPPLDIQIEISDKIEKLLSLCNSLENSIGQVSKKQVQILNSVLANI